MRIFFTILFVAATLRPAFAEQVAAPSLDVSKWPRMSLRDFGCMLEKSLGHREPKFNCSLRSFKANENPCDSAYYEGFEFPAALVSKVNPLLASIDLEWEHGQLQSVSFDFKKKIDPVSLKNAFGFSAGRGLPPNIIGVDVQDCSHDGVCLVIDGFDHIGAGDAECDSRSK